ncbi:hypothetical protein WKW79_33300 [Variovorax robiniae]|uniref:DUF995 domain-containing protein n=1 Tax=Variovorax robiniae TaxID=1836199 RepID=A0ABU8XHW9_9BURK
MKLSSRLLFWMTCMLSLVAALGALLHPIPAVADDRSYLSKVQVQESLVGKAIQSKNLQSGAVSHWAYHPDGTVEASRAGMGKASGTWAIREDGQMCVTMVKRTGCRYWFRKGEMLANADTNSPDAPVVAEVQFE